jgi:transposase
MRRYALRDDQWDRIKDFLPGREGHVGGTAADNRLFVEAVLYRCRAGIPWRDLPERFEDWKIVHQRAHTTTASKACRAARADCRDPTVSYPARTAPACHAALRSMC